MGSPKKGKTDETCVLNMPISPKRPQEKLTHLNVVSDWHYPGWPFGTPINPSPECGDRIELSRSWWPMDYRLWGLLLEHDTVIIFGEDCRSHWGVGEDLKITMVSLFELSGWSSIRINNRDDERFELKGHNVPEKQIVWMRYKEFVETWPKHMFKDTNHNEAFVNFCRYGNRFSHQANVYPANFPQKWSEKCAIM